jgi:hypothetical protein
MFIEKLQDFFGGSVKENRLFGSVMIVFGLVALGYIVVVLRTSNTIVATVAGKNSSFVMWCEVMPLPAASNIETKNAPLLRFLIVMDA